MKILEEKIISFIIEYYKNNRMVDSYFIEKVVEIVVNEKGLSEYVKKVEFNTNKNQSTMLENASYQIQKKIITVNTFKLLEYLLKEYALTNFFLGSLPARYNYYLQAVQQILHEIEHASQLKKIDNTDFHNFTDEELLIKIAIDIVLIYSYDNYLENYSLNPIERMAQINSYDLIGKIAKKLDVNEKLNKYLKLRLLEEKIQGYGESESQIVGPTSVYLREKKLDFIKTKLRCYQNPQDIYFNEKLYLGVEISPNSFSAMNTEIAELQHELKRPF